MLMLFQLANLGVNIVWLFDPNDIQTMFSKEGSCPSRRSHLALEKYRVDRPHLYNNGGLLPTNGPQWARLRTESQKPLAMQSSLGKFNFEITNVNDFDRKYIKTRPCFKLLMRSFQLNPTETTRLRVGMTSQISLAKHPLLGLC